MLSYRREEVVLHVLSARSAARSSSFLIKGAECLLIERLAVGKGTPFASLKCSPKEKAHAETVPDLRVVYTCLQDRSSISREVQRTHRQQQQPNRLPSTPVGPKWR